MIYARGLNAHLTDSRWRWRGHPLTVVLARLASAAKVRLGRDAAGTDRLGELAFSHSISLLIGVSLLTGTRLARPING